MIELKIADGNTANDRLRSGKLEIRIFVALKISWTKLDLCVTTKFRTALIS